MTDLLVEVSSFLAYLVGKLILGVIMETMDMLCLLIKAVLNTVPLLDVSSVIPSLNLFLSGRSWRYHGLWN
jgi:hypothetical protein